MSPPTLRFSIGSTVAPGDRLGNLRQVTPGEGTYARGGHVFSSLVGTLELSSNDDNACIVSAKSSKPLATKHVLKVGQLVLGKVQRIMLQQVSLELVAAGGGGILSAAVEAQIRREDVRPSATEDLKLDTCFVPGDVVLARIVAMGDTRRYLLTTAEPELGVVRAVSSKTQTPMQAVSWKEMQCPDTGRKEPRKVAKPSASTSLQEMMMMK